MYPLRLYMALLLVVRTSGDAKARNMITIAAAHHYRNQEGLGETERSSTLSLQTSSTFVGTSIFLHPPHELVNLENLAARLYWRLLKPGDSNMLQQRRSWNVA